MPRALPTVVIGALVAALVAGGVWLAVDDGPYGIRVGAQEVSRHTLDDELAALHDNPALASSLVGAQVGPFEAGSLPADITKRWIDLRVQGLFAEAELERRGESIDADDRDAVGFPTTGEYREVPASVRRVVIDAIAASQVLQRSVADEPGARQRSVDACPSARFVSHILVATAEDADAVAADLAGGADFATLARERSLDTGSAAQGGQLGCLDDLGETVEPFGDVAASQPIGEVSEPFETQFGFHVVLVTAEPAAGTVDTGVLEAVQVLLRDADVDVAERYGSWDRQSAQVLPPRAPTE